MRFAFPPRATQRPTVCYQAHDKGRAIHQFFALARRNPIWVVCALMLIQGFHGEVVRAQFLSHQDIGRLPAAPADHRIPYGKDPSQFGELRLPKSEGPHPVAIVIHGGCWLSAFDLRLTAPLSEALTNAGIATWNIEFRRADSPGGGWPGTFLDVATAVDHLRELATEHRLDLNRVIIIGHSAGGHLALWAAARHRLPEKSALFRKNPLPVRGVVSLAGISDLRSYLRESAGCGKPILKLLGGSPEEVPERYREASPIEMLPLGVKQTLITGAQDKIVPPAHTQAYGSAAEKSGDEVELVIVEKAAHFEVIAPDSPGWPAVESAALSLLR